MVVTATLFAAIAPSLLLTLPAVVVIDARAPASMPLVMLPFVSKTYVLLLSTLAALIVILFLLLKTPTDYRKGFVSSELASNMLNTFLRTAAVECSQLSMTELLQDCAQSGGSEGFGVVTCDNGDDSCKFVKSSAAKIFKDTLGKWGMKYQFLAYTNPQSPFIDIGDECKGEKKSKLFPIPTSTNILYTKLDICG